MRFVHVLTFSLLSLNGYAASLQFDSTLPQAAFAAAEIQAALPASGRANAIPLKLDPTLAPQAYALSRDAATGALTVRGGDPRGLLYGGLELAEQLRLSPGSYGHAGGLSTQAWVDPVKGVAYVLMVQRPTGSNSYSNGVRRAFLQAAAGALAKRRE
jgi:CubicO group peptidase (beta-lactamase class C family)